MKKITILRPCFLLCILLSVFGTLSYAQTGSVSGKILNENKEGLIGATAKIKGTSIGAAADVDGNFLIPAVPLGKQRIIVTYVGYTTKELDIYVEEGKNELGDFVLKEDKLLLNEVVVVGYGTQVKRELSSSISSVKAEDIKDKPVYNFTSALQGKASGVQITTDNGLAGANTQVRIRGTKTLSATAEPLYVVDGVPIVAFDISDAAGRLGYNTSPLSTIPSSDIENIEILKDAAATAIYGARGANGVVLITTKSGKNGKTKIDVTYNVGLSQPAKKLKLLDGKQWVDLYREAWRNDSMEFGKAPLQNKDVYNGFNLNKAANTNWVDEMFRPGYFNDAQLGISGGNEKTTFYVGGGIRDEISFLKGNDFQRINLRTNINHEANKTFSFGVNTGLTRTVNNYVRTGPNGGLGFAQSAMLPIYPLKDSATGSYYDAFAFGGIQNPVADVELVKNKGETYRLISNGYIEARFLKYFRWRNEISTDLIFQNENFYLPRNMTSDDTAVAADRRNTLVTWNYNSILGFEKDFNEKHFLGITAVFNPTHTKEKYSYIEGRGFPTDSYDEPNSAIKIQNYSNAGTGREFSFMSAVGRINYNYKRKHLFQLSIRADGSSRFSPNNRWGYFPAFSYAWIVSDENFMQKQKVVDFLKIRVSTGSSGNAEFTSDFLYFPSYRGGSNYNGLPGFTPDKTSVSDLGWETTLKSNFGIDFGFLKNRISGMVEVYYEYTYNMLIQSAPLSPSSGFTTVARNMGKMQNYGFELQLTSNNLAAKFPLQWKTVVNFGFNRNKILDLGDVKEVGGTNYGDNRAIVGQPVGTWFIAKYAGVDPNTGRLLIYDLQGNKVEATAANSVTYRQPIGRPYPLFYGGINNVLTWKGLELEVMLTYSYGNMIYDDAGKRQLGNMQYGFNQTAQTLNRWQKPGDITDVQKLSLNRNYDINTSQNLYDASFLRLRNITLSYNLPEKATKALHARSLRLFLSGQNLAVATPYQGWDPETNRDRSGPITQGVTYLATPQARTFSFGFNVGL